MSFFGTAPQLLWMQPRNSDIYHGKLAVSHLAQLIADPNTDQKKLEEVLTWISTEHTRIYLMSIPEPPPVPPRPVGEYPVRTNLEPLKPPVELPQGEYRYGDDEYSLQIRTRRKRIKKEGE
jgi:hypothetical protein